MKPIKLTEEHKSKLLEMCKELFPEDVFSFNNDCAEDGMIDRNFAGNNVKPVKRLHWNDEGSHFHWFELCLTYLFEKIFVSPNGYESVNDYIGMNSVYTIGHPVDYLYEEFKKLK